MSTPKKPQLNLKSGFTLIELLIIMAIIGILFSIAIPNYRHTLQKTRESVLKENLYTMRDAINKFYHDKKKYPLDLEELVSSRYLHDIPSDPIARNRLWDPVLDQPLDPDMMDFSGDPLGIIDVKSTATGQDSHGIPYNEY